MNNYNRCLAEFAAWFKFSKLNARSEQSNEEYDEPIDLMQMKKITLKKLPNSKWHNGKISLKIFQ